MSFAATLGEYCVGVAPSRIRFDYTTQQKSVESARPVRQIKSTKFGRFGFIPGTAAFCIAIRLFPLPPRDSFYELRAFCPVTVFFSVDYHRFLRPGSIPQSGTLKILQEALDRLEDRQ